MCLETAYSDKFLNDFKTTCYKNNIHYIQMFKEIRIEQGSKRYKSVYTKYIYKKGVNIEKYPSRNIISSDCKRYKRGFHSSSRLPKVRDTDGTTIKPVYVPVETITCVGTQWEMRCIVSSSFSFRKPRSKKNNIATFKEIQNFRRKNQK